MKIIIIILRELPLILNYLSYQSLRLSLAFIFQWFGLPIKIKVFIRTLNILNSMFT